MQGVALEVSARPVQFPVETDHPVGSTSLLLTTVDGMPLTGSLDIGGDIIDYSAVDPDTLTVTLATPTTVELFEGDVVLLWPHVIEKWAIVELQADDDPIFALVPNALWDRMAEGVREEDDREVVVIDQQDGDWRVADILSQVPVLDGELIDPDTLPVAADTTQIAESLAELINQVSTNTEDISSNAAAIENAAELAEDAGTLASIANVTTTLSDFPPGPFDAVGRRNGSLWMARTRPRINHITNPSFETNTTGWSVSQLSVARETVLPMSGSYSARLTNSGVSGMHSFTFNGSGGAALPVAAEGQSWAGSIYAAAVSGVNLGVYVRLVWYDTGGSEIGTTDGTPLDLLTDDYQQLEVVGVAPAGATSVGLRVSNPAGSEASVWRVDGAMLEQDDITGKYFDGRSYDAAWDPVTAPDATISEMNGGRIIGIWELGDGGWVEKQFSGTILADIDAANITQGYLDGERIQDNSIPQDKLTGTPCTAGEALLAGDLVNIWNSGGTFQMRKADADNDRPAHGFVLQDVAAEEIAPYYTSGYNPFMTGLSPGIQFLSTTPGKCASTPPSAVGSMHQRVGVAAATLVLNFTYSPPLKITS